MFYAKLNISKGTNSPVVLLLSFGWGGYENNTSVNDLYIYGSFKNKKPSVETHLDISEKNCNRILITEPSGRLNFGQTKTLYLAFETL